jgi:hypothetical protein
MKHFLLILMAVAALACPPNCLNCFDIKRFCFICAEGYEWKQTGTCVDANTIPRCTVYSPEDKCLECQPTFALVGGKCEKEYSACLSRKLTDLNKCSYCEIGTVLSNDTCVGTPLCTNSQNGVCNECVNGFIAIGNMCIDNTGNCAILGTKGLCLNCKPGFSLQGYICIKDSVAPGNCYIYS